MKALQVALSNKEYAKHERTSEIEGRRSKGHIMLLSFTLKKTEKRQKLFYHSFYLSISVCK